LKKVYGLNFLQANNNKEPAKNPTKLQPSTSFQRKNLRNKKKKNVHTNFCFSKNNNNNTHHHHHQTKQQNMKRKKVLAAIFIV
jgi:hypothetical protein